MAHQKLCVHIFYIKYPSLTLLFDTNISSFQCQYVKQLSDLDKVFSTVRILNTLSDGSSTIRSLEGTFKETTSEILQQALAQSNLNEKMIKDVIAVKGFNDAEEETIVQAILSSRANDKNAKGLGKVTSAAKGLIGVLNKIPVYLKVIGGAFAVFGVALWLFDEFNDSIEEIQDRIDVLNDDIATLNGELDELRKKDELSSVEKTRLAYLENQLSVQERLLDVENKRMAQAKLSGDGWFGFASGKDYTETGSYYDLYKSNDAEKIRDEYDFGQQILDNVWAEYEQALKDKDDEAAADFLQTYKDDLSAIESIYGDALGEIIQYQTAIADLEESFANGDYTPGTSDYNKAQEYYNYYKKELDSLMTLIGDYESRTGSGNTFFDYVIQQSGYAKDALVRMAEDGSIETVGGGLTNLYGPLGKVATLLSDAGVPAQEFIDYLKELGVVAEETAAKTSVYEPADIFALKDAEGEINKLGELNEQLDKIQAAYKNLSDAIDTYNDTGYITIDQFQAIVEQGDDFLDYLTLEDGQLGVNEQAMYDLAEARIIEMKQRMISGVLDNIENLEDEAQADIYLASTNYELAESYNALTEARLKDWYASTTLDNKDEVLDKAKADIAKINALVAKIDIKSIGGGSGGGAEKDFKAMLDAEITLLEKQLDNGKLVFKDYLDKRFALIQDYYDKGLIEADEYYSQLEATYQSQLDIYDRVLSAVERRYDKEIEKINETIEGIEKQNESLELELERQDAILSVVEEVYNKQIDALKEQQDLLDDRIDKLQDEADENQRLLDIEEARKNLAEARMRRSVFLYTEDDGYIYTQNQEEIKQYENELKDLERDQVIDELEKEKEALQESIDQLEKYKEEWAEIPALREEAANRELAIALWGANYEQVILDNREAVYEAFKTNYLSIQKQIEDNQGLIDSYNEKIEYYEKLKEQWADIANVYEEAQGDMYAAQVLGADWESLVLDGREDRLEAFKKNYIDAQTAMAQAAEDAADRIVRANNKAGTGGGASGVGGGSNDTSTTTSTFVNPNPDPARYTLVSQGYDTRGEATSKILNFGGEGVIKGNDGKYYVYKLKKGLGGGRTNDTTVAQFSTGGKITKDASSFLDPIAQSLGEDHMVAVTEGERILTPAESTFWEKYNLSAGASKSLQPYSSTARPLDSLRQKGSAIRPVNKPAVSYGDITIIMNGVNDAPTFAQVLKQQLPSILAQIN